MLEFVPAHVLRAPWTPFTYMFVHGGIWHILFNMLVLYFFGPRVEERLGSSHFIALYLISRIDGRAVLRRFHSVRRRSSVHRAPCSESSSRTRAIWPRDSVFIYGVLPIQVRWLVVAHGGRCRSLASADSSLASHTWHTSADSSARASISSCWSTRPDAHAFARRNRRSVRAQVKQPAPPRGDDMRRWSTIPRSELHEINRQEVDRLLDKISLKGIDSLTPAERAALDRFSKQKS